MPSGILWGKECVIGAGCVVDPGVFIEELDDFERRGISTERLRLSGNAHVIMPWHLAIDRSTERRLGKLRIGTTRRGIGPTYADEVCDLGVRGGDLCDPRVRRGKVEVALAGKNVWLERVYGERHLDLLAQPLGVDQVLHADPEAVGLDRVGRADAPSRRA